MLITAHDERNRWPIEPPDTIDAIRNRSGAPEEISSF
jgi:hypothetical protein